MNRSPTESAQTLPVCWLMYPRVHVRTKRKGPFSQLCVDYDTMRVKRCRLGYTLCRKGYTLGFFNGNDWESLSFRDFRYLEESRRQKLESLESLVTRTNRNHFFSTIGPQNHSKTVSVQRESETSGPRPFPRSPRRE